MRSFKHLVGIPTLLGITLLIGLVAVTQLADAASAAPAQGRAGVSRTTTVEDEIVVRGKVYRPAVFDLLTRYRLGLNWSLDAPRFKRPFLDKVLQSVKKRPF